MTVAQASDQNLGDQGYHSLEEKTEHEAGERHMQLAWVEEEVGQREEGEGKMPGWKQAGEEEMVYRV